MAGQTSLLPGQQFKADSLLLTPKASNTATAPGQVVYDSTHTSLHTFDTVDDTLGIFATSLAPVNGNVVVWITSGGKSTLGDGGVGPGGGGGGSGTVTSASCSNFTPLFNCAVATSTVTPAFSFTAQKQAGNLVYAGPAREAPLTQPLEPW